MLKKIYSLFCRPLTFMVACSICPPLASHSQPTKYPDSIVVAVAPHYDSVSGIHRMLFGEGYRKLWAAPVKVRVFDLGKEKGGLTILERGGGNQTNSLRFEDKNGKQYVVRSIEKFPERSLPQGLRKTVARDILQDQIITGHPFSALTVPPLAEALQLPHSHPEVVYIPADPRFGDYQKDFTNTVLLFEEREPVEIYKTDNTDKTQRKLEEDNDRLVNQRLVLRARLLDLVLGDWDRHEDQWRWEVVKEPGDNEVEYVPIPRDRDKVFYHTTGFFPWLLSHQWLKANLQGFKREIRDIPEYNYNNRYFDRYFLNQLSEAEWKQEIALVQKTLTDELLSDAVHLMPDTIYALTGDHIIDVLKARRNDLGNEALKYYRFLSKNPDIVASDKKEQIEIDYKTNGQVGISIRKIKKDSTRGQFIYQRTFDPRVTNEVRLYGLNGEDVFKVYGSGVTPINVRLIGGKSTDSFFVANEVSGRNKLLVYDRSDLPNYIDGSNVATIKTSTDTMVNNFDRKSFRYDQKRLTGSAFYNADQGFLLRAGFIIEKQGFRKEPYAARHLFTVNYATLWRSFMFSYAGKFRHALGKNDLSIDLVSRGPSNIDNFFGVGNETVFTDNSKEALKYFQNYYDYVHGEVMLHRMLSKNLNIYFGPGAEFYTSKSSDNKNRFLSVYNAQHKDERVFSDQFFAGALAGFQLNTREESLMPDRGIYWNTELRAMKQVNGLKNSYGRVFSSFSFYIPVKDSFFIIANRVAGGTIVGDPAFYQQHKLGGPINLRGYNLSRFTGKSVFYNNTELRLKLFDFTSYITPGTLGLIGFYDVGRVWSPGENSKTWHTGYGGGVYIIPAELIVIQGLVGFSKEGTYPYFAIGYRF